MHELGLVAHIIKTVEEMAAEQKLTEVASLTLELGEVSSVLPDYLTDCWNYAHKKSELLKNTELKLQIIPAVTLCDDCGKTYPTVKYKKKCPYCESMFTHLVAGDEFSIKEMEAC